eukprot:576890-Rhodomonas_salina.1
MGNYLGGGNSYFNTRGTEILPENPGYAYPGTLVQGGTRGTRVEPLPGYPYPVHPGYPGGTPGPRDDPQHTRIHVYRAHQLAQRSRPGTRVQGTRVPPGYPPSCVFEFVWAGAAVNFGMFLAWKLAVGTYLTTAPVERRSYEVMCTTVSIHVPE